MKAVLQRVLNANLKVNKVTVSEIEKGYVIFLGVKKGDTLVDADYIVKKISNLRIFEDDKGKINYSIQDVKGEILLVSQFTLLANSSHGNRPDFLDAEVPIKAKEMYLYVASKLKLINIPVKLGVFGEDMKITQENDGPFTILIDSEK